MPLALASGASGALIAHGTLLLLDMEVEDSKVLRDRPDEPRGQHRVSVPQACWD